MPTSCPNLIQLLLQWQEQRRDGNPVTPEELCAETPELLEALKEQIASLELSAANASREGSTASNENDPATVPQQVEIQGLRPSPPGYEVLAELGRGGMGVVYKALQMKAKRVVALKMILSGGHASRADLERFRIEGESVARLQHPNIVQVFDVGDHANTPYFALEFCEGGNLARKLAGTPLPGRDAAILVEKLARAIAEAHSKGIIHRDLKPANVLLTASGEPKVTDFGLAKQLDSNPTREQGNELTQTGAVMGTPSYMAPEQASGDSKHVDMPCDVYALGAILYECLTGRPPFKGATFFETLDQVRNQEPVPPSQLNVKTPRDLDTICLKCLRKEPAKRYGQALALAEELRRYLDGKPILARPVGRMERGLKWIRRNPMESAFITVIALLLLVGSTLVYAKYLDAKEQEGIARKNEASAESQRDLAERAIDEMRTKIIDNPHLRDSGAPEDLELRHELSREVIALYQTFAEESIDNKPKRRLKRARAYRMIAETHFAFEERQETFDYASKAYEIYRELAREDSTNADYVVGEIAALNLLASSASWLQRQQEALDYLLQAKTKGLQIASLTTVESFGLQLQTYENLVAFYSGRHSWDDAHLTCEEGLERYRTAIGVFSSEAGIQRHGLNLYSMMGLINASGDRGDKQLAVNVHRQAIAVARQLVNAHPDRSDYEVQLAICLLNLNSALVVDKPEQRQEIKAILEEGLEISTKLMTRFPKIPKHQELAAMFRFELGDWHAHSGNQSAAETDFRDGFRLIEELTIRFPKSDLRSLQAKGQFKTAFHDHQKGFIFQQARGNSSGPFDIVAKLHATEFSDRTEKALTSAIGLLELTRPIQKGNPGANRETLFDCYLLRYQNHLNSGNLGDAWFDLKRALELAPLYRANELADKKAKLGIAIAQTALPAANNFASIREHSKAIAALKPLLELSLTGAQRYNIACVYAICSGLAAKSLLADDYALQALAHLEKARMEGFFAESKEIELLQKDTDFDSIRQRKEFQEFVQALKPLK